MSQLGKIRRIQKALGDLRRANAAAEESARFELTQSTRHFSRKTQEVIDDTMALSATLIRAGEVEEANLLIAEIEREVQEEQAALQLSMKAMEAERAVRRRKMARLRVARLLAAMVTGASLMAVSVAGIAVAGMFANRGDDRSASAQADALRNRRSPRQSVKIAGVSVKLTPKQLETYMSLSGGGQVNSLEVQELLSAVLPQVPVSLVDQVQSAIVTAAQIEVPAAVQELTDAAKEVASPPKDDEEVAESESGSDGETQAAAGSGEEGEANAEADSGTENADSGTDAGGEDDGTKGGGESGQTPKLPLPDGAPKVEPPTDS